MDKTLSNQDGNGVQKNVPDVQFFGDPDGFQLICKASSQAEGWMKSTKAMEIPGAGCLVQVSTQQRNESDGSYVIAEALTFVPETKIVIGLDENGNLIGRKLMPIPETINSLSLSKSFDNTADALEAIRHQGDIDEQ